MIDLIVRSIVTIQFCFVSYCRPKTCNDSFFYPWFIWFNYNFDFPQKYWSKAFKANKLRFTSVSEAFGAIKEIKLGGLEEIYIERYSKPAKKFAMNQSSFQVINQLPRFTLR